MLKVTQSIRGFHSEAFSDIKSNAVEANIKKAKELLDSDQNWSLFQDVSGGLDEHGLRMRGQVNQAARASVELISK